MTVATAIRRAGAALAVGAAVAGLTLLGHHRPAPAGSHGACFSALRLLRHAVAAFEAQHGYLPGHPGPASDGEAPADEQAAALMLRQLTRPRSAGGVPSRTGPLPGLLAAVPPNPYTGSAEIVVVPRGADAVAFAAASRAGWAYLLRPGADAAGALPPGFVLPCGTTPGAPGSGAGTVQEIAFEIEDFERWR